MPEPTYRIAQALHARRAAVGLKKYGQHLTADSPGCMLVHALEESADKTNYLIAEVHRRKRVLEMLIPLADWLTPDDPIAAAVDLLGGRAALAKYDEILGGAEDATVAPEPTDVDAQFDPQKIVAEAVSRFATKHTAPDPRDEALRVATEALECVCKLRKRTEATHQAAYEAMFKLPGRKVFENAAAALAAIRGAR